jgi:hypothetical protein
MRRTCLSLLTVVALVAAFRGLEHRYGPHAVPLADRSRSPQWVPSADSQSPGTRTYVSQLAPLDHGMPILADHPDFVEPLQPAIRLQAKPIVVDASGDLEVRAWRYSYNARGIIETVNRLDASATAIIVVHPWGVDDGQGWQSPEPAGVALFCTPEKNQLYRRHVREVVQPFLKEQRGKVRLIGYSLPGREDPIRKKLYASVHGQPSVQDRAEGQRKLAAKLKAFAYTGEPLPQRVDLEAGHAAFDHIRKVPTLDSGSRYNGAGYWDLPIPLVADLQAEPADVVFYDGDGYPVIRDYLRRHGVRHVLLAGYCTDLCLISTAAGYKNLAPDFNVFIVGDATLATFPAAATPRHATNAALCQASLEQFITQVSWVRPLTVPAQPVARRHSLE